MIDIKKIIYNSVLVLLLGIVFFILLSGFFGCSSVPKRENFDIPESFDRATCGYYAKDRKLFGTSTHNVLECEKESKSLSQARKEDRAYRRIKYCKDFNTKGFQTMRECVLYVEK